jgi:hypothetical protein
MGALHITHSCHTVDNSALLSEANLGGWWVRCMTRFQTSASAEVSYQDGSTMTVTLEGMYHGLAIVHACAQAWGLQNVSLHLS